MAGTGLRIRVERVQGKCNAGLREGDCFTADGLRISPEGHDRCCRVAEATLILNAGRAPLAPGRKVLLSCMDPGTGEGGNVVFSVSLPDAGTTPDSSPPVPSGAGAVPEVYFQPVEVIGTCPAGLDEHSRFTVDGMRLSDEGSPACPAAVAHWLVSLWQLHSGRRFFAHASCPGCFSAGNGDEDEVDSRENRVVFLGGHADKWELSQVISEYLRTARVMGENEAAAALKSEAVAMQDRGDFPGALERMKSALSALGGEDR